MVSCLGLDGMVFAGSALFEAVLVEVVLVEAGFVRFDLADAGLADAGLADAGLDGLSSSCHCAWELRGKAAQAARAEQAARAIERPMEPKRRIEGSGLWKDRKMIIRDSLGWERPRPGSTFLGRWWIGVVRHGHFLEGQDRFDRLVGLPLLFGGQGCRGEGIGMGTGIFCGDLVWGSLWGFAREPA